MLHKKIKRRGQALVFYALLIPIFLLCAGVGLDLGWYYLTVSRLQNAADAAVLAGAWKLIHEEDGLNNYYVHALTDRQPDDFKEYTKVSTYSEGKKTEKDVDVDGGQDEAEVYANKNLSNTAEKDNVQDAYNTIEQLKGVTLTSNLYAKLFDIEQKKNGKRYYKVTLEENVGHLFLRNFEPMEARVVAYALLKPRAKDMVATSNELEQTKVIANWEYQNIYKTALGKWNHFKDDSSHYEKGDVYRTETINVQQTGGSGLSTSANAGKTYYAEKDVDALNLDFKQDVQFSSAPTKYDWDLGMEQYLPKNVTYSSISSTRDNWIDKTNASKYRIHNTINFNYAYTNRNILNKGVNKLTGDDLTPDILWTRIEMEPMWGNIPDGKGGTSREQKGLNSVRQLIINVNVSNAKVEEFDVTNEDGTKSKQYAYRYRPFFIFYTGPETNVESSSRHSQPVVINLYADWNAILYMPNSEVIINGNGHKFTGFVIAENFNKLKTGDELIGYSKFTDAYDNTLYIKSGDTLSPSQVNSLLESDQMKGYDYAGDAHKSLYIFKKDAVKYLLENYETVSKKYGGITDSNKVTVYPYYLENGNNNYTAAAGADDYKGKEHVSETPLVVSSEDLFDYDTVKNQLGNYFKVRYGDTDKYILREKMPFIEIYPTALKYRKVIKKYVPCNVKLYDTKPSNDFVEVTLAEGATIKYVSKYSEDLQRKTSGLAAGTYYTVSVDFNANEDKTRYISKDSADILDSIPSDADVNDYMIIVADGTKKWIYKSFVNDDAGTWTGYDYTRLQQIFDEDGNKILVLAEAITKTVRKLETDSGIMYLDDNAEDIDYYMEYTPDHYGQQILDKSGNVITEANGLKNISNSQKVKNISTPTDASTLLLDKWGNLQLKYKTFRDQITLSVNSSNGQVTYKKLDDLTNLEGLLNNSNENKYWRKQLDPKEKPEDLDENKVYVSELTGEIITARRPLFERVYLRDKKEVFNVASDSYYSFFLIEDYIRKVYTYLNVDELNGEPKDANQIEDMFFTTVRASWID